MFSLETFAICGEDFVLKCCVEFAVQFRIFLHQLWWAGLSCTVVKAVKTLWSVWTVCELWSVKFVKHLEREQLFSFLSWVKWLSSNRLTEEVFQTDPPTLPPHPTFFLSFIFILFFIIYWFWFCSTSHFDSFSVSFHLASAAFAFPSISDAVGIECSGQRSCVEVNKC